MLQTALFIFKYTQDAQPQVFRNFFLYNRNFRPLYPTPNPNNHNIHLNNPKLLSAHKSLRNMHGPMYGTPAHIIRNIPHS